MRVMLYCLNPTCPHPQNPEHNAHCQYCGVPIALRNRFIASKLLGQGGFGKTYLAQDLDNRNKPCVIKRLTYKGPNAQSTEKARQLFEQEAERLDQLVHPQIPRLLAYFQEASYLYLVQEVIEGQTLHQEFESDGPFNESNLRLLLNGLLPVLKFVHSRNVIHRDIKPSNVLLSDRSGNHVGDIHLIDFGSVQTAAVKEFGTRTVVGTYGYMPIEQFGDRTVPASDIYSLGATLIYLVTGTHPADLPVRDGRIQFEDVTSLSPEFTQWLKATTEPTIETRIKSAREALIGLQQPKLDINSVSNSLSQIIRGDWSWNGKSWIPKSQHLLLSSIQDKFKSDAIKLTKPSGSKVILHKGKDNLEILIPAIGFQPSLIYLGLFATAWNSLTLLWTVGAFSSSTFPINLLFALLSLPFWGSGFFLIYSFIFSLFGKVRLC